MLPLPLRLEPLHKRYAFTSRQGGQRQPCSSFGLLVWKTEASPWPLSSFQSCLTNSPQRFSVCSLPELSSKGCLSGGRTGSYGELAPLGGIHVRPGHLEPSGTSGGEAPGWGGSSSICRSRGAPHHHSQASSVRSRGIQAEASGRPFRSPPESLKQIQGFGGKFGSPFTPDT